MPIVYDRRSFLKVMGSGAVVTAASRYVHAEPKAEVRWALLSDIHIAADNGDTYRGFHPHENLKTALGQVSAAPFDAMIVNGDLARQQGNPADYEVVSEHLDPVTEKLPVAITLGNHDDRKNARNALAKVNGDIQPVEKKFVTTIDVGPCEFILLDSLMVTNIAPGQLGNSQREWLAEYLRRNTGKPTVIFVHHNPDADDDNALTDAARLLEIAQAARNVKAIFYGHTHAWKHERRNDVHLVNIPAVAYNFKDTEPIGWTDAYFSAKGARLKLNAIGGNTSRNGEMLQLTWRA
jgi:Icc protein